MSSRNQTMDYDDDLEDNISPSSGLLHEGSPRKDMSKDKEDVPFCGCLSVRYYQPFFDVDTSEVTERVSHSLMYCRRNDSFISSIKDKPDLYGPFWITTSLVFTVAFCSHMSAWLSSWMYGSNWENDFAALVNAASLIYGYATCGPTMVYFALRQFDISVGFIPLICLYGYSMTSFIIASLVCLIPSNTFIWLSLLGAALTSSVFLMRNLTPLVMERSPGNVKSASIAIGVLQLLFAVILKAAIFSP